MSRKASRGNVKAILNGSEVYTFRTTLKLTSKLFLAYTYKPHYLWCEGDAHIVPQESELWLYVGMWKGREFHLFTLCEDAFVGTRLLWWLQNWAVEHKRPLLQHLERSISSPPPGMFWFLSRCVCLLITHRRSCSWVKLWIWAPAKPGRRMAIPVHRLWTWFVLE